MYVIKIKKFQISIWNRKFGKEVSYQMFVYWCQFKIYCIMDSEFLPNFDKQIYQCFFFDKLVKLVKIQGSFVCSKVLTFKPIFNFEFLFCYNSLIDIFFTYYIDLIQYCPREQDWIRLIDICDGKTRKFRWLWISQFELEIYFLYVIRSKNLNLQ